MNVTVMVPNSLRTAVEGRRRLELGVPSSADVGDVLQTLFKLYPKLASHLPNERKPVRQHLNAFLASGPVRDAGGRRTGRDGLTLYLFASNGGPPPLKPSPSRSGRG